MIKIDRFVRHGGVKEYCEVALKVLPVRPTNIPEKKFGKDVAEHSDDYHIADDGGFYMLVGSVATTHTIERLIDMQREAQKEFSLEILKLKESLDKFKRLRALARETK